MAVAEVIKEVVDSEMAEVIEEIIMDLEEDITITDLKAAMEAEMEEVDIIKIKEMIHLIEVLTIIGLTIMMPKGFISI